MRKNYTSIFIIKPSHALRMRTQAQTDRPTDRHNTADVKSCRQKINTCKNRLYIFECLYLCYDIVSTYRIYKYV